MNENIIEEIRKFVEEESKKPTAHYGYEPYKHHLVFVHNYSKMLAEKLKADKEIAELAAWLHDIGSIIHGRENHHVTGAEIAERKLMELNYPKDRIEKVKKCIFNHRGSVNNEKESIEEKIIADADSLSHFDNIGGLFMAAFIYEHKGQAEANESVRRKLTNSWNKLSLQESKNIIKPKYEAAMILLK